MGVISGRVVTQMIANGWKVLEGSVQISLENIKAVLTTTIKSEKSVLHTRQSEIVRKV